MHLKILDIKDKGETLKVDLSGGYGIHQIYKYHQTSGFIIEIGKLLDFTDLHTKNKFEYLKLKYG